MEKKVQKYWQTQKIQKAFNKKANKPRPVWKAPIKTELAYIFNNTTSTNTIFVKGKACFFN